MSRINELIKELCPNGVEYKKICNICNVVGRIGFRGYKREDQVEKGNGAISLSPSNIINGKINYNDCTYISWGKYNESPEIMVSDGDVIFCKTASVGKTCYIENMPEKTTINPQLILLKNISINAKYLSYCLQTNDFQIKANSIKGLGTIPTLSQKDFNELTVPVPPLEVQEEIVRILDKFGELEAELEAELEVRKSQYEFWRGELFKDSTNLITIGEACDVLTGGEPPEDIIKGIESDDEHPYPVYGNGKEIYGYSSSYRVDKDSTVISSIGANTGAIYYRQAFFTPIIRLKVVVPKSDNLLPKYLYYALQTSKFKSKSGSVPNLNANDIKSIRFPLVSIEEQKRIVNILDKFEKLISDISIGLPAEIELRRQQYEYYRNKLLSFEELSVSE